jgi:hypothetical protein
MEELPESLQRRLAELDELFGPEQAAHGESYQERLREDDELSARVRKRFDHGKASGKYPVLSVFLSNLSAKEKEEFFRTGGGFRAFAPSQHRARGRGRQVQATAEAVIEGT